MESGPQERGDAALECGARGLFVVDAGDYDFEHLLPEMPPALQHGSKAGAQCPLLWELGFTGFFAVFPDAEENIARCFVEIETEGLESQFDFAVPDDRRVVFSDALEADRGQARFRIVPAGEVAGTSFLVAARRAARADEYLKIGARWPLLPEEQAMFDRIRREAAPADRPAQ